MKISNIAELYTKMYTKASILGAFFVSIPQKRNPTWEKPGFNIVPGATPGFATMLYKGTIKSKNLPNT